MKQKPAFILDLRLPPGTFDVNVTPDKREIFMTGVSSNGYKLPRLFSVTHVGDNDHQICMQLSSPPDSGSLKRASTASLQRTYAWYIYIYM